MQLFSHLEGDALNVAHLVPLARRLSRSGLVDELTAHYGSPGRLADYGRQFEQTTRTMGEDTAIFATALETLAIKAFGDMGQTTRLRLIRNRFIAGHSNCDLRRHLDSVPPETPIRDVVDRCRVWESHADPVVCRMSKPTPDPTYPTYAVGDTDREPPDRPPAVVNTPVPPILEHMLRSFLDDSADGNGSLSDSGSSETATIPEGLVGRDVLLLWEDGPCSDILSGL